jgi:succinylglutamate desuccinylase
LHGGLGFGIELGQKGFSDCHTEFGISLLLKMITYLTQLTEMPPLEKADFRNTFTFDSTVITKSGKFRPAENIQNLTPITKGTVVGELDESTVVAVEDIQVIFLKRPLSGKLNPGEEAFRYIRPVSMQEIEAHIVVL